MDASVNSMINTFGCSNEMHIADYKTRHILIQSYEKLKVAYKSYVEVKSLIKLNNVDINNCENYRNKYYIALDYFETASKCIKNTIKHMSAHNESINIDKKMKDSIEHNITIDYINIELYIKNIFDSHKLFELFNTCLFDMKWKCKKLKLEDVNNITDLFPKLYKHFKNLYEIFNQVTDIIPYCIKLFVVWGMHTLHPFMSSLHKRKDCKCILLRDCNCNNSIFITYPSPFDNKSVLYKRECTDILCTLDGLIDNLELSNTSNITHSNIDFDYSICILDMNTCCDTLINDLKTSLTDKTIINNINVSNLQK